MKAVRPTLAGLAAVLFAALPAGVLAEPKTQVMQRGGSLQVYATNTDDRAYTCTFSMMWSHSSFGVRRDVVVKQAIDIAPRSADALIYAAGSGNFDVRIDAQPTLVCT